MLKKTRQNRQPTTGVPRLDWQLGDLYRGVTTFGNHTRHLVPRGWVSGWMGVTLPETNVFAPENRPKPNRKGLYSNHPFSGAMLVSGRVVDVT